MFGYNWLVNNENFFKIGCVIYKYKYLYIKCNIMKGIGWKYNGVKMV